MLRYLIICVCFAQLSYGQTLQGRVYDASNQIPLPGAHVEWLRTGNGVVTSSNGRFQLVFESPDTLLISFVGYAARKIGVSSTEQFLQIPMQIAENVLSDVVIAAYGLDSRAVDIPASVGIIKREALFRDNGTTIVPAMNRIPGVFMQSGAFNTNRLTIRGIGSRSAFATSKIRAYFKSIPLTTGDGETNIENTDISLLSRAEVLRGPSSSMYGAGLGGTVLLQMPEPENMLNTSLVVGSYGLIKSNTSAMIQNNKTSWGVEYNVLHSDGYRENNQYDRKTATISGNVYLGANTTLSLLATGIDLVAYIPSSIDSATYSSSPRSAAPTWAATKGFEDTRNYLAGLDLEHYFTNDVSINVSLFNTGANSFELRPFNILELRNSTVGSRGIGTVAKKMYRIQFGYEYFYESYFWQTFENSNDVKGNMLSDNHEIRQYVNGFAQFSYFFSPKVSATLGFNINKTAYHLDDNYRADSINQTGDYGFEPIFSPRLALQYKLSDGQVYASVSQGFSPPSFDETLAPDGLINPDLKPEKGTSYEVGYKGSVGNLSVEASLFTMQISDLLVTRRLIDDQTIGINAGKTAHNGLETQVQYRIPSASHAFTPFLGFTYANYTFIDFVDGDNDYSGNQLTGVPGYVLNVGVDWHMSSGFYGNMNLQNVARMPITDDNSVYTSAYGILNFKVGYAIEVKKWNFDLHAGVNNLLDEKYVSMVQINAPSFGSPPRYYYPGLPINYFGGLGIGYRFKDD